jgi:[ribosomal protein S5]-alanine N-acetyltransferase
MILEKQLNTSRLYLRSLTECDCNKEYLSWLNDDYTNKFLEVKHHPPKDLRSLYSTVETLNNSKTDLFLGIFLLHDHRHIGNIRLGPINSLHLNSGIGFLIGEKSCTGLGYASEAIKAVCKYGMDTFKIKKINASCYSENIASRKTLLKSNFKEEGTLKSQLILNKCRVDSTIYGFSNNSQNQ